MPEWVQAAVLGIVQGLTEFFPVSSDGHLVLVPYLLGWDTPGLAFDVALHMGTLAALLLFFRREITAIVLGVFGFGPADPGLCRRLAGYIVVATIPVSVVGYFLKDLIGGQLRNPLVASAFLVGTAGLLTLAEAIRSRRVAHAKQQTLVQQPDVAWTGDWIGDQPHTSQSSLGGLPVGEDTEDPAGSTLAEITFRQAMTVGLVQPLALLPGLSRSGSTIVAGVFAGLTREAATRFSFLLATPALLGAFVLSIGDLSAPGPYSGGTIAIGIVSSFVAGYFAIHLLVRLVARDSLAIFARYCLVAAAVGLIGYLIIG